MNRFLPEELKSSVNLRSPGPGDEDSVEDYFQSLGETSRAFFHPHPFDREHAEMICRDTDPAAFRMVAECGDRIVGCAWFSPSDKSPHPMVGIGVSDDFQGKRLGGAMLDALIAEAKTRRHAGLRLTVYKENERGVRLYQSRGCRIVGEKGPEHVMELVFDHSDQSG